MYVQEGLYLRKGCAQGRTVRTGRAVSKEGLCPRKNCTYRKGCI